MEEDIIILTDDEGNELECEYLDTINYQGKDYVVLYPLDQDADAEEGGVVIMEVVSIDDENEEYLPVDDEDLLDAVFDEFMRIAELEE